MLIGPHEYDPSCEDTLGGRISFGREAAGLTIAQAARGLGVMTQSWNAWERDRDMPRGSRLTMMAGLLGVSPSWLLTGMGTGPVERSTDSSADLMRAFRQTVAEVAILNRRMKEIAESLDRQQVGERTATAI